MNLQQSDRLFLDLRKCITQHCNHKPKEKVVGPLLVKCLHMIYEYFELWAAPTSV